MANPPNGHEEAERAAFTVSDGIPLGIYAANCFTNQTAHLVARTPFLRLGADRAAISLHVGRANRDGLRDSSLGAQPDHHPGEDRMDLK